MDVFWKITAIVLVALILGLALSNQQKDIRAMMTIAVCCMTGIVALEMLEPVLDFIHQMSEWIKVEDELIRSLMKVVGIALVSDIVSGICFDAGSSSLGKSLQFTASAVMLYLSIPIFQTFICIIQEMLGAS